MHKVTRRIWKRGLNLKKWCEINNFPYRYAVIVMSGKRGQWGVGVAQKIKDALIAQGFATHEDFPEVEE